MQNSTENNDELLEGEVEFIPEGSSFTEQLLRSVILGYQNAFNQHNDKNEVKFTMTITSHKISTPGGNKDVAYLRIDRAIKLKEADEFDPAVLIHQEVYYFKGIKERVNPKAPWKEQLYVNALARLTSAGLEYAELLRRMSQIERNKPTEPKLEIVQNMLAPLTEQDEKYKEWVSQERKKEGLS